MKNLFEIIIDRHPTLLDDFSNYHDDLRINSIDKEDKLYHAERIAEIEELEPTEHSIQSFVDYVFSLITESS